MFYPSETCFLEFEGLVAKKLMKIDRLVSVKTLASFRQIIP
jgi:hypothetical protein